MACRIWRAECDEDGGISTNIGCIENVIGDIKSVHFGNQNVSDFVAFGSLVIELYRFCSGGV